jgi:hypothetical protein
MKDLADGSRMKRLPARKGRAGCPQPAVGCAMSDGAPGGRALPLPGKGGGARGATRPTGERIGGLLSLLILWVAWMAAVNPGFSADTNGNNSTGTNGISADEIPPLRPPLPGMPPSLWEEHRGLILAAGGLVLALGGGLGWYLTRPKPQVPQTPLAHAREELEPLRNQPETGLVLSKVSQAVRHYFGTAFSLPPGELTTAEFCRAIERADKVGPELGTAVEEFLHRCDERKFAPMPVQPPLGAVNQATSLIDQAESRRAALAQVPGAPDGR